jgi:signal transduction histidine kinase
MVLLKPVTRCALRAFLGQRRLQWEEQHGESGRRPGELRAERDEMLQCLIEANLRLQEYDRERTNLLARAVHDFRAPLTALRGYCGLLLAEQLGSVAPEQKEVLARMQRSANRLSRMANTMFQFSVAQANKSIDLKPGDVRECIEQALHEIAPYADEKRITLSVDVIASPEPLLFEHSQLEQVLVNLLDNACKFTPCAGFIEVRGYPFFWERRAGRGLATKPGDRRQSQLSGPNAFRVDVHDSGPGVPAAHMEDIFGEYTSYPGGCDRSGGGLGLAICKLIVDQHKGRIWAESVPAGATFSFVLPFQGAQTHSRGEECSFGKAAARGVN